MRLSDLKAEQLEAYLDSLTPQAAAFLVREVERDRLNGGTSFPHDFVLTRARELLANDAIVSERHVTPQRVFCLPFEDLLLDKTHVEKVVGQISRSSIPAIWTWLKHEVAPDVISRLEQAWTDEHGARHPPTVAADCEQIYQSLSMEISKRLDGLVPNGKPYLRIAAQLGDASVLEDAREIAHCFKAARSYLTYREQFPTRISGASSPNIDTCRELYDAFAQEHPTHGYLLLSTILRRSQRVADALRIICGIVGTNNVDALAGHQARIVIEAMLSDLESAGVLAIEATRDRTSSVKFFAHLSTFRNLANGLTETIDLLPSSAWNKRLSMARKRVSAAVRDHILAAPQTVKGALFPRRFARDLASEKSELHPVDADKVADALFYVRLLVGLRDYLDQLSINAVYSETFAQVEQYLTVIGERLLSELVHRQGPSVAVVSAYVDALAGVSAAVFGDENSALLLRRADAAKQAALEAASKAG